jgi:cytochrome c554/c'-like protein
MLLFLTALKTIPIKHFKNYSIYNRNLVSFHEFIISQLSLTFPKGGIMQKNISFIMMVLLLVAFSSTSLLGQDGKSWEFIGVKKCGMCHKKEADGQQLKIWEESQHANAYKTLKTEAADKIAAEKGFKTKAVETAECLACHASGHDVDAKLLDKKFNIDDGVQCETCHGAGSGYKAKKVMESREESVKNGLIVYKDDAAIEAQCVTCHNDKSPTYKEFKFKEMYAKIIHNIPEKK